MLFPEDIEKILEIAEEKLIRIRMPLDVVQLLSEDANEGKMGIVIVKEPSTKLD